ncbi:MAG: enoyl-ACP reductase FabI [Candidatus Dormibacteraeota bacterium]|nr:enoyl-ACP reductase FabI [Candidatus Dormibacteraeota bacterium]MBV9526143.1 enoyl-ACP reductase FabI [Candidatus Dormibacteraeota bacterium]
MSASPRSAAGATNLLRGKRVLVTGVLTPKSIAFAIASACQDAGAQVVLTSFGRAMSLTRRSAQRMAPAPEVLEMDATDVEQVRAVAGQVRDSWGGLDAVVHAIGFAPEDCLGGGFLDAPWASVSTAFHVSSYSLRTLAAEFVPLMPETGGAIVSLTFDASVAWPLYDWMGPAKAALESITRYLARDLGHRHVRVNSLAAGPLETIAAKSIPGFDTLKTSWQEQAPLGWDSADAAPVADACVFLLSDLARGVTGEVLHVDGGFHSQGAPSAALTAGARA